MHLPCTQGIVGVSNIYLGGIMKVRLLGAAQTVTGSCYMIEACGARFTVDCGMHQGNKTIEERNFNTDLYDAPHIDFILMTHAHIDHSGLVPRMVREGFNKPVYCTGPTLNLLEIMLLDSAHIQEMEAKFRAEKYKRRGKTPPPMLYSTEDAEKALPLLHEVHYGKSFEPHAGITVTYYDAGHILGSAYIYIEAVEDGKKTTVLFSGDLGKPDTLIICDPTPPKPADYIFMESTYGDREHNSSIEPAAELAEAIAYSYSKGEKVIIPAFAVERTQEMLYCLHKLHKDNKLPEDMPIYVDSPLAIKATEVFSKYSDLFDDDAKALLAKGEDPFSLPNLHYTMQAAESRELNEMSGSAIIISASGMCNAGRIRHHLRHNLWRTGASIVFVGYQGVGTPGRKIVEKADSIKLFGDDIPVSAKIYTIGGFSAHAGQSQLLEWVKPAATKGSNIVLTHGEEKAQRALAKRLEEVYGSKVFIPDYLEELELVPNAEPSIIKHEGPRQSVDWSSLGQDLQGKLQTLQSKMQDIESKSLEEQAELRDRMASLDYELTKLITRI